MSDVAATSLDQVLQVSEQLTYADQLRLISLLSERLRHKLGQEEKPLSVDRNSAACPGTQERLPSLCQIKTS